MRRLPDPVLEHEVKLVRPLDKRLLRDAVVFLVSFMALLALFLAKYYALFSPPFALIFVAWLVCTGATVDFCRHAWSRYVKPHFFDR